MAANITVASLMAAERRGSVPNIMPDTPHNALLITPATTSAAEPSGVGSTRCWKVAFMLQFRGAELPHPRKHSANNRHAPPPEGGKPPGKRPHLGERRSL